MRAGAAVNMSKANSVKGAKIFLHTPVIKSPSKDVYEEK